MSDADARPLYELPKQVLVAIGKELDRYPAGPHGWRNVMEKGFPDLYPHDSSTFSNKRYKFASKLSPDDGHGAGLAFLRDLSEQNVREDRLIRELEKVGHDGALALLKPPGELIRNTRATVLRLSAWQGCQQWQFLAQRTASILTNDTVGALV